MATKTCLTRLKSCSVALFAAAVAVVASGSLRADDDAPGEADEGDYDGLNGEAVQVESSLFTRLDGTVYHGNDANRAIITNWQSQVYGHRPLAAPAPNTLDLFIVYDQPSADYVLAKEGETLEHYSAVAVAKMNEVLVHTDLDTNYWFRLVGWTTFDVDSGTVSECLNKMLGRTSEAYNFINEWRDKTGADIVVGMTTHAGGISGLALQLEKGHISTYHESGYASCLISYVDGSNQVMIHEVGHLMTCGHADANAAGARGCFIPSADGSTTYATVMAGLGGYVPAYSSPNHMYNGTVLSLNNKFDCTGRLLEVANKYAVWRETKVPDAAQVEYFPITGASILDGAKITLKYQNPDAEIHYIEPYGDKVDRIYTEPIESTSIGGMHYVQSYALVDGVSTVTNYAMYYDSSYPYLQFNGIDAALGAPGLPWANVEKPSTAWTVTADESHSGGTAIVSGRDANRLSNIRKPSYSAVSTIVEGPAKVKFWHKDNFTTGSFAVWVDDEVGFKEPMESVSDEWVQDEVVIEAEGLHEVQFIYTERVGGAAGCVYLDDVTVEAYTPSTDKTAANLTWAGASDGSGVWSRGVGDTPWSGGYYYTDASAVTFPDLAAAEATVTVSGAVAPRAFNLSATATAYTFAAADADARLTLPGTGQFAQKANLTFRVPVATSASEFISASGRTLIFAAPFGTLSEDGLSGTFSGAIKVEKYTTVLIAPGEGKTQNIDNFGKAWSYTDSTLEISNGTVRATGAINGDAGLFQHKRVYVKKGGVLEFAVADATGYGMGGGNSYDSLVIEAGGEAVIDAGDRLHRALTLAGGTLTIAGGALDFYNGVAVSVSADSLLRRTADAASATISGAATTFTFSNGATLTNAVPLASESCGLTLAGTGAMVLDAPVRVTAFTLGSGVSLVLPVTDATTSPLLTATASASFGGAVRVTCPDDLPDGTYPLMSLPDGATAPTVTLPTLVGRAVETVTANGVVSLSVSTRTTTLDLGGEESVTVPWTWVAAYYPEIATYPASQLDTMMGAFLSDASANRKSNGSAWTRWESYILGLDPTNEEETFVVTIRLVDGAPVIEYSPTNTALAIQYILEGKASLTNDWTATSFAAPRSDFRFFRTRVTWGQ